jgi:hypothetical protein
MYEKHQQLECHRRRTGQQVRWQSSVVPSTYRRERKETRVFRRKRKPPSKPFTHDEGCRIVAVDPGVEIPWSHLGDGRWKAECVCGAEYFNESAVDDPVRLDPLDPKTSRHSGPCEYVSETDPAVLKVLLKVKPGMGEGYDWVEFGGCGAG